MTAEPTTYDQLVDARERCITELRQSLTVDERKFLVSLKDGNPQWKLLGIQGIEALPSLQWKLVNIRKMKESKPAKHAEYLRKLISILGV